MRGTMLALWLSDRRLELRRVSVPEPAPGEALVRLRVAGVCATDLELVRGYYPYDGIPGHEFVGVVEAVNAPPEGAARVGARVVGRINAACGACPACRAGRP